MKKLVSGHPYGKESKQNVKTGTNTKIPKETNTQTSPEFFNLIKFGHFEFVHSWWTRYVITNRIVTLYNFNYNVKIQDKKFLF
jgi:hypothetical protein